MPKTMTRVKSPMRIIGLFRKDKGETVGISVRLSYVVYRRSWMNLHPARSW